MSKLTHYYVVPNARLALTLTFLPSFHPNDTSHTPLTPQTDPDRTWTLKQATARPRHQLKQHQCPRCASFVIAQRPVHASAQAKH